MGKRSTETPLGDTETRAGIGSSQFLATGVAVAAVVATIFVAVGLQVKSGQLADRCNNWWVPGLATGIGWALAIATGLITLIVGSLTGGWRSSSAAIALALASLAAPTAYGLALAIGPNGADPCGYLEPPKSFSGIAQVSLLIATEPFAGRLDRDAQCEVWAETGHMSSLLPAADPEWTIGDWHVELELHSLSQPLPEQDLTIGFFAPASKPAVYGSRGQTGWQLDRAADGGGRITFDALPLAPGAEWDAPDQISGSISWTCTPYE